MMGQGYRDVGLTEDQKRAAVVRLQVARLKGHRSGAVKALADELGVSPQTLSNWEKTLGGAGKVSKAATKAKSAKKRAKKAVAQAAK